MMRRGVMLAGITILAALVLAAPAGAITYGTPDGDGHPQVGARRRRRPIPMGPGRPARARSSPRRSSSPPPTATWRSTALP